MSRRGKAVRTNSENPGLPLNLEDALDGVEDEVLVIDGDYRLKFANAAARKRFPRHDEPLTGQFCYQVLQESRQPCKSPPWNCPLQQVIQSGHISTATYHVPDAGGDRYLQFTAYPLRDSCGNTNAIVEIIRDVTADSLHNRNG